MTCATCPNCGYAMERLTRLTIGNLSIDGQMGDIRWRGEPVHLTLSERLLVHALAQGGGYPISKMALAEATGCDESKDPANIVQVFLVRVRKKFRAIDPQFDAIETLWAVGVRWKVDAPSEERGGVRVARGHITRDVVSAPPETQPHNLSPAASTRVPAGAFH